MSSTWTSRPSTWCTSAPSSARSIRTRAPRYGRRLPELVRPGGVLAGYFELGERRGGPPYEITREDLDALLTPAFALETDQPSDRADAGVRERAVDGLATPRLKDAGRTAGV